MRATNKYLARSYAEFNRKYFQNKLPKDMAVRFMDGPECGYLSVKFDRPLWIMLNKKLAWHHMLVDMCLLHEMVHVEQAKFGGHGPRFHKRMLQLAKQGAFKNCW
jgi:hypothetical protein